MHGAPVYMDLVASRERLMVGSSSWAGSALRDSGSVADSPDPHAKRAERYCELTRHQRRARARTPHSHVRRPALPGYVRWGVITASEANQAV